MEAPLLIDLAVATRGKILFDKGIGDQADRSEKDEGVKKKTREKELMGFLGRRKR